MAEISTTEIENIIKTFAIALILLNTAILVIKVIGNRTASAIKR